MSNEIAIGWYGPTHDYWDWILGHFQDVTPLTARNVDAWTAAQRTSSLHGEARKPAALLIATDSRYDSQIAFVRHFEQTVAPKSSSGGQLPWCALLGDDWVGHRRTHSLPESIQTFYWYELYDRVFPWLTSVSNPESGHAMESDTVSNKRRISPRVQRCIEASLAIKTRLHPITTSGKSIQLALVVTETATTRQLWNDALTAQGVKCFSTTPDNLEIWAGPDLIVVDLESEPLVVRQSIDPAGLYNTRENLIQRLSLQFPDAIILTTEAFPRWEAWNSLRQSGADMIVAKPFQVTGVFDTLQRVSRSPGY